jgi:hypothetical protein
MAGVERRGSSGSRVRSSIGILLALRRLWVETVAVEGKLTRCDRVVNIDQFYVDQVNVDSR